MNQEEKTLRESIRHLIRHVKQNKVIEEENQLRNIIRKMMDFDLVEGQTPDVDPAPNKSTGINVLEELLKKIIPILETDYKSLTTNPDQRESYRAHIINAVDNSLTPAKLNNQAGEMAAAVDEEIEINVGDDTGDDKFIDIRSDAEKSAEEEEEEEDPRSTFGGDVEGNETGRNVAYQSYKKIESTILDAYELLADPEDQELFYDYLIANLKLYFEKFEEELASQVEEPTNQAYDMAKSEEPTQAAEDDIELEL
jgi:hypothetical protein|tara:strand:+ start:7157 stop:7918 length:762 start_codon:yes stop_codon:yes gene_type:complete